MGRAIKKKWFTAYAGSEQGNLTVLTTEGPREIIKQTGTGVYQVAEGRVKLIDGVPAVAADGANGIVGDAQLVHDGRNVRKINQYRLTYFADGDAGTSDDGVWRDGDSAIVGVFVPPLTVEGDEPGAPEPEPVVPETATATATQSGGVIDSITIVSGGAGYASAPTVIITDELIGTGATATATIDADGVVDSITIDDGGTDYDDPITVTIDAP